MTCVCRKIHHSVSKQRVITTFNAQNVTKEQSKYRGSISALSMFIHYSNYTHRISNVSHGPIFEEELYLEGYLGWFTGGLYSECLYVGFYRISENAPSWL